jgi:two-component system response regulator
MSETSDVLLVEDNPSDLELTLHMFRRHHLAARVTVARDGAEALDLIFGTRTGGAKRRFELVLLGLNLPKVTGAEVLRRIKANPETAVCPVVILTSSADMRGRTETCKPGTSSYIVRPVDPGQFNAAVRQLGVHSLVLNQLPAGS